MKAMIFAAGIGSRLKPFTDKHPKALAPVNGKPLIQRTIEYLKQYGFSELVINVHHFASQITEFLGQHQNFGCTIQFSDESEELLETGGGLKKAAPLLKSDKPILVINADILTNLNLDNLIRYHKSVQSLVTLAVTNRSSSRNFLFDNDNLLCGWTNNQTGELILKKETESPVPKAFSGIHVINPDLFQLMRQTGKFSIVDTYLDLCSTHRISGFDHSEDLFIDVGKPEALARASALFA